MKEMIKGNPIFIGLVIAIMPIFVFRSFDIQVFALSFLLAGLAAGFMAGSSKKAGLLNGAILGVIGGIIFFILSLSLTTVYEIIIGHTTITWITFCLTLIVLSIEMLVIAVLGGLMGSMVREGLVGEHIEFLDMFESYKYNIPTALGYIFGLLGGFIGLIAAIYLLTRKDKIAKAHGIIILGIFVLWILLGIYFGLLYFSYNDILNLR